MWNRTVGRRSRTDEEGNQKDQEGAHTEGARKQQGAPKESLSSQQGAKKGVDLSYIDGLASLSFRQVFQETSKVVEDEFREYYPVWKTDSPIELHETTGWAIFFSIEQRKRERAQSRGESPEASTSKARKRSTVAKELPAAKGAAEVTGTESPTAMSRGNLADPEAIDELNDAAIIGEQAMTIKELVRTLKAYEEKFGKL